MRWVFKIKNPKKDIKYEQWKHGPFQKNKN